jgi:exopolyphosphatase / guanosine-5'-triphosphate,3'-diphosphate pyrophosphatase
LRLYEEHVRDAEDVELAHRRLARHIRAVLVPAIAQIREYRFETLIGTSGTVLGLAALDAAEEGVPIQRVHGYVLRLERIRALQRRMLAMTPSERRRMPGMNPRRSDIIVAGAAILITTLELLERDSIVACERALREGVVVDFLERNIALARRLGDERMRRLDSAHALARRFGAAVAHEHHVAALALMLFDGFADLHRFEPADRDVLFGAALVHDVGRSINASAHHKHGAYIVRGAGLPGWDGAQLDLIATLVRYHRKALPKPTHPEWMQAAAAARERILGLGAMLRLADGLDRRHLGVVTHVEIERSRDGFELRVHAQQDPSPEIAAARFKADLFARAFPGVPLEFVAVRDDYGSAGGSEDSAEEIDAASMSG